MRNYSGLLREILNIIGFNDDKNDFIKQFDENIRVETSLQLINSLDDGKKQKVIDEFVRNVKHPEKSEKVLASYFSKKEVTQTAGEVVNKAIDDFLVEIYDSLNEQQRSEIAKLLEDLRKEE